MANMRERSGGPRRELRLVEGNGDDGRVPTGDEVLCEAAQLAVQYLRLHLNRLSFDDPLRDTIAAVVSRGPGPGGP